jgi:hypothetical protein
MDRREGAQAGQTWLEVSRALSEDPIDAAAEAALDAGPRALLGGRVPFFIGAFPKSGTTWLQVMLDAHPDIACRGEGHLMNQLAPRLTELIARHNAYIRTKNESLFAGIAAYPLLDGDAIRHLIATAVALSLAQIPGGAPVRAVGEKTPDALLHFPLLARLFPAARFIHLVRDGRDCAVSAWYHNQRVNPDQTSQRFRDFEAFLDTVAGSWVGFNEAGRRFGAAHPDRYLVVSYEELAGAPEATLGRVLGFLGVGASAGSLARCAAQGAFERMTGGRRAGEADAGSFLRNGLPGDWERHFSAAANHRFLAIAGALLGLLGYV